MKTTATTLKMTTAFRIQANRISRKQRILPLSITVCLMLVVEQEKLAVRCKSLWPPLALPLLQPAASVMTKTNELAALSQQSNLAPPIGIGGQSGASGLWRTVMDYNWNRARSRGYGRQPNGSVAAEQVLAAASALNEVRAPNLRVRPAALTSASSTINGSRRFEQATRVETNDRDSDLDSADSDGLDGEGFDDDDSDEATGMGSNVRGANLGSESSRRGQQFSLRARQQQQKEPSRRRQMTHEGASAQDKGEMAEDERRGQEAADEAASEAEAADRSALDEQRQQQREIILAQAQSEAKAIKEQQEALLRQQLALQQLLLARQREASAASANYHQSLKAHPKRNNNSNNLRPDSLHYQHDRKRAMISGNEENFKPKQSLKLTEREKEHEKLLLQSSSGEGAFGKPLDTQFSDQPDGEFDETAAASDVMAAAQHHHYHGVPHHYGSGGGHKDDYYQYAESHKKGQFDAGFKRGGKKFQISGHSSQNKGHAEGHVKWLGKKGKGTQYWDLKHKDRKKLPHYGHSSFAYDSYDQGHQQHYY